MALRHLAAADGQWPRLLIELAGLVPEQLQNRHQPCPACGGTDRFRWDQDAGGGSWFCNQCGGKEHSGGGGNGLDLLLRVSGWDFATAVRRVEAHLGLPAGASPAQPEPLLPLPQLPTATRAAEVRPAARASSRPARIPEQPPSSAPPPELGRATAQWPYRNAKGELLFWVQRLDLQQGGRSRKVFVQRTWLDGGWHFPSRRDPFRSDWPAPRPLYRLPELERHPWSEVLITEGEKAADAAALLFPDLVVISWCGGSNALQTVDWAPLAQRPVILWPDADAAGREAMAKLSALLLELNCSVSVVLPPSCTPEDWDLADAPGADGWDLADTDWTPAQAMAHLMRYRRQVQRPEHPPDPQDQGRDHAPGHAENASTAPPASPAAAADQPAGPRAADRPPGPTPPAAAGVAAAVNAEPFQCLGYDSDGYYYQPQATGQVVRPWRREPLPPGTARLLGNPLSLQAGGELDRCRIRSLLPPGPGGDV